MWKYIGLFVIVLPAVWYMTASFFFSANVYPWQIINSMPLVGNATQVANEDKTNQLCGLTSISRLYVTDTPWDEVYAFYLNHLRLQYTDAAVHVFPNVKKDHLSVLRMINGTVITLQRRILGLSVRRVHEAGPTFGTYIWTSNDSNVRDAVSKANSAYEISIRYISNAEAYRENCTD